ncbi:hypothetical protein ACSRDH_19665, partial [Acinetobacter baumannii]|uniref:hypothetical protein n=1 Tax=Acinetobacter baumannii TaxID=470 RepID=UPI003ED9C251
TSPGQQCSHRMVQAQHQASVWLIILTQTLQVTCEGGFEDRPKRSFGGEDRPRREFNSDRPRREGG